MRAYIYTGMRDAGSGSGGGVEVVGGASPTALQAQREGAPMDVEHPGGGEGHGAARGRGLHVFAEGQHALPQCRMAPEGATAAARMAAGQHAPPRHPTGLGGAAGGGEGHGATPQPDRAVGVASADEGRVTGLCAPPRHCYVSGGAIAGEERDVGRGCAMWGAGRGACEWCTPLFTLEPIVWGAQCPGGAWGDWPGRPGSGRRTPLPAPHGARVRCCGGGERGRRRRRARPGAGYIPIPAAHRPHPCARSTEARRHPPGRGRARRTPA